jgi:hypothetical protein
MIKFRFVDYIFDLLFRTDIRHADDIDGFFVILAGSSPGNPFSSLPQRI